MEKSVTLEDALKKIYDQMEKKKEIEKLIAGMIATTEIWFPGEDINYELQRYNKQAGITNDFKYLVMSTKDAIKDILSGYGHEDWIPESYIIELLRGGGKDIKNETINQELSRMHTVTGEIEKKRGDDGNSYKLIVNGKKTSTESISHLIVPKSKSNPSFPDVIVEVIRENPWSNKWKILNCLVEKKYKFKSGDMDENLDKLGVTLSAMLKRKTRRIKHKEEGKYYIYHIVGGRTKFKSNKENT